MSQSPPEAPSKSPAFIWHNGAIKPFAEATVHVMAHGLHYGSSVFEGIRVYATPMGPVGFRLSEHIDRLFDSARVYHMPMPFDRATLVDACRAVVLANGYESAYLRPIAFRGHGELGVVPSKATPTDVAIAAVPWGAYLGEEGRTHGVDVCIASWNRLAPNTIPAGVKAGGNYLSSQLISGEAKRRGYAEGIGLGPDGTLSEGAGENLFVVRDGRLYTPPSGSSILSGFTRDTVRHLAALEGIDFVEQVMPREMLYVADELFFTGTAAEITPIRSVDDIPVRCGGRGPITQRLQELFFGLFAGTTPDRWGWLEPIRHDAAMEQQHAATAVSL